MTLVDSNRDEEVFMGKVMVKGRWWQCMVVVLMFGGLGDDNVMIAMVGNYNDGNNC